MSAFTVFDRLVRYANYLRVYRLEDYERLRPAVALRPHEMRNFELDPRHEGKPPPSIFCGLHVFEADD